MPQDFNVGADNQKIDQQRLKALQEQAKANGEVFPYDKVKVYATKKAVDSKHLPEIKKIGQEYEVHSVHAEKLVEKGLFTMEAPKEEKATKEKTSGK